MNLNLSKVFPFLVSVLHLLPPQSPFLADLDLETQQVANHLSTSDTGSVPESLDVEGAGKAVGKAKEEHRGDPATGILEGKARLGHLVLLDDAAAQVVHGAGRVDLGLVLAGDVRLLDASKNVEVVVGGVAAGVALGADGSAEDDEVLCDACVALVFGRYDLNGERGHTSVDNVHGTHCATGIVKHPLLMDIDVARQLLAQLVDNVLDNSLRVVAVRGDAALRQVLEMVEVEDVELIEVLLGDVEDGGEQGREHGEDAEEGGHSALGLGCRRFLSAGLGHCV